MSYPIFNKHKYCKYQQEGGNIGFSMDDYT